MSWLWMLCVLISWFAIEVIYYLARLHESHRYGGFPQIPRDFGRAMVAGVEFSLPQLPRQSRTALTSTSGLYGFARNEQPLGSGADSVPKFEL